MPTLDVFEGDAFSAISLTRAVDRVPYVPLMLGRLNIFQEVPVMTQQVAVERREGIISIIPTTHRGGAATESALEKRTLRNYSTPRLKKHDPVPVASIANLRAFGSDTALMSIQDEVMRRLSKLRRDMELTWEYHRFGAINGVVLDADGTTPIVNWFTEFGISPPTPIAFDLDVETTNVRAKCAAVRRAIQTAAKVPDGMPFAVHGLVGDAFFDALVDHDHVRSTYLNTEAARELRGATDFASASFGGITFHNYRGTDDSSPLAIGDDEARFFPVGLPDVFEVALSPHESAPFVNTMGLPVYANLVVDNSNGDLPEWFKPVIASYPLHICKVPEVLQRGTRT